MYTFEKFLRNRSEAVFESPVAMRGNMKRNFHVEYVSASAIERSYAKPSGFINTSLGNLELRRHKTSNFYILGKIVLVPTPDNKEKDHEEKFWQVGAIYLEREIDLEKRLRSKHRKYTKVVRVDSIYLDEAIRERGVGTKIYKFLVNEMGFTILGDSYQYFGARKLWVSLSKNVKLNVDIIDVNTAEVLESNVILKHGDDEEYDNRLWSYYPNVTKEDTRPILTKII